MGIRYYGRPIPADHVAIASENPRFYLCCSGVYDRWADESPSLARPGLDLDKTFNDLRCLFRAAADEPDRPSASLVAGRVRQSGYGWTPHYGVLSDRSVRAIAADLASIDLDELIAATPDESKYRSPDEDGHIRPYFDQAVECTATWARAGLGTLYSIG